MLPYLDLPKVPGVDYYIVWGRGCSEVGGWVGGHAGSPLHMMKLWTWVIWLLEILGECLWWAGPWDPVGVFSAVNAGLRVSPSRATQEQRGVSAPCGTPQSRLVGLPTLLPPSPLELFQA